MRCSCSCFAFWFRLLRFDASLLRTRRSSDDERAERASDAAADAHAPRHPGGHVRRRRDGALELVGGRAPQAGARRARRARHAEAHPRADAEAGPARVGLLLEQREARRRRGAERRGGRDDRQLGARRIARRRRDQSRRAERIVLEERATGAHLLGDGGHLVRRELPHPSDRRELLVRQRERRLRERHRHRHRRQLRERLSAAKTGGVRGGLRVGALRVLQVDAGRGALQPRRVAQTGRRSHLVLCALLVLLHRETARDVHDFVRQVLIVRERRGSSSSRSVRDRRGRLPVGGGEAENAGCIACTAADALVESCPEAVGCCCCCCGDVSDGGGVLEEELRRV